MSAKLTGIVWELELPHPQQTLLLALADNAHDDGTRCYPGVDYLVWKTGYDRRSIQRILRQLEADGLVVPVAGTEGGRGHELEYRIDLSKGKRKRPWREVKLELRKERQRAAICHPLEGEMGGIVPPIPGEVKGGNLSPFTEAKGRQPEQERAASVPLKGGISNTPPSITEPNTNQPLTKNTHTPAPAPQAAPSNALVGACVCKFKHGSEFCDEVRLDYAKSKGTFRDPGSYAQHPDVRAGRDDILIRDWLDSRQPAAVDAARAALPDTRKTLGEARQWLRSVLSTVKNYDVAGCIEQMDVSEETKRQLRAEFLTAEVGSAAGD